MFLFYRQNPKTTIDLQRAVTRTHWVTLFDNQIEVLTETNFEELHRRYTNNPEIMAIGEFRRLGI